MALLVYVGPFRDGVTIPALGELVVEPGVPFEVVDEGAVQALLAQPGNFALADPAKPAKPAKGTDTATAGED